MSQALSPHRILTPLTPLYKLGLWLRERRLGSGAEPVRRLWYPVVSIGNLSTGGAGKTPFTIALARALMARGWQVSVLSRGYGRQGDAAARVSADGTAGEFGDEPLVIAREAGVPVYVAKERYDAGVLAAADALAISALGEDAKPVVHLLDDGFQHRQLAREVDVLLLDRRDWMDRLLPAGNLREPLAAARRATVLAIPASQADLELELRAWGWMGPVWRLKRRMEIPAVHGPVAAFCGIARPEQFFGGLQAAGVVIAVSKIYSDHHVYTAGDVKRLARAAAESDAAALVTTAKDRVRLGGLADGFPSAVPLLTVGLRVEIEREEEAMSWLIGRMGHSQPAQPL